MSHFDLLLVGIYSSIIHRSLKFVNKFQFDFEEEIEKKNDGTAKIKNEHTRV
jgi:hypothetical protein